MGQGEQPDIHPCVLLLFTGELLASQQTDLGPPPTPAEPGPPISGQFSGPSSPGIPLRQWQAPALQALFILVKRQNLLLGPLGHAPTGRPTSPVYSVYWRQGRPTVGQAS